MPRTLTRFAAKAMGSVGLCAAAIVLSPDVAAAPLKTGGYECVEQSAAADPAAATAALCAPIADMAGIPMALPGPLPVGAAAVGIPPIPIVVPPVPVGVPPVPVGVPPVPVGVPPVPVGVPPVPV
ncbi:MAG: beta-xylosidase, partial [Mycobacterium sp.]